ncbi:MULTISPECIES: thiol-disulfide oxidoreductase DCC family protein [Psychrobacillus]|jgi:predicted DCC family thiol-disulfide oxidoreductase YuxK|uniref:Thiol-disulfide oxidoreductase DCC family protein n=1 Tax=Psychrobacillus faecigallinarum TaxID=2762235 RepID=A0ABR8RBX6_9BACI|nr:thiol-disulfide oxidoreductase DCC family protein [Psychrobacillus faecigallinarum]MBD7945303.1 thiol-disulfide oxidoreductase DCC family protein [Psychrobacillus faecigallinarum]QGM32285.1 DUF393 domain-containing protein [Bacillus sp. N3536]
MAEAIVMFDGVCNFCDSSVQFIIKRDSKGYFQFAALQSDAGMKLKEQYSISHNIDSFILIEDGKVYKFSDGALRVCRNLEGIWRYMYIFIFVPRPIRNSIYKFIAKNRYKWFGQKDSCMLPSPEVRSRFL